MPPSRFESLKRGGKREPLGDADCELAFLFQLLIGLKIFPGGVVLDGSDAVFGEIGQGQLDAAAPLFGCGRRNLRAGKRHRRTFFEHARGVARGVMLDFTAARIGCGPGDPGKLQSEGIYHGYVPGNVRQEHWILWRHFVELLPVRKLFFGPERMVPASADNPLAGPPFSHRVAQTLLQFGDRGSAVHTNIQ